MDAVNLREESTDIYLTPKTAFLFKFTLIIHFFSRHGSFSKASASPFPTDGAAVTPPSGGLDPSLPLLLLVVEVWLSLPSSAIFTDEDDEDSE